MRRRPATDARVAALFAAQRVLFARLWPGVAGARLTIVASRCPTGSRRCAKRDLAWMEGGDVFILRRALALPLDNVLGLLAHELGHAADPTPDAPLSEQRADDLAERALGRRVRYDAGDVQTLGPGAWPRPKGRLHA